MNPSSFTLATLLATLIAAPATAQQGEEKQHAERIAELERQLAALDEEVESLRFGDTIAPVNAEGMNGLAPAASKIYSADQGLSIGGYGEMLFTDRDSGREIDIYRAIVYLGYRFDDNWLFNSEIEWEHGNETALEFAYLEYQSDQAWNVRVGHQLVPMGIINQLHEPTTFLSPNRPLVERYILPTTWHENGALVYGDVGEVQYTVALMNGFDAENFDLESSGLRGGRQGGSRAKSDDFASIVRLDWDNGEGLWLGGSIYMGDSGQDNATEDFSTTIFEAHAQYEAGGFLTRAVYASASIDDASQLTTAAASDDLSGYYVDFGYDVFAEGERDDSLITFLRYSAYDLAEDSAADTEVTRLMLGLAWQPLPQLIFKLALTNEEQGSNDDDILEFATGYVF